MSYKVNDYWKGEEWVWDKAYHSLTGKYYTEKCLTFILSSVKVQGKGIKSILDVGGGTGRFAIPLHKMGYKITVLDIDEKALKKLNIAEKDIDTLYGDIFKINIRKKFDLVISIGTIKYLDDFEKFIQQVSNVLNSKGYILIEMLNPLSLRAYIRRLLNYTSYSIELNPFECMAKLRRNNFEIISKEGAFWLVPPYACKNKSLFWIAKFLEDIFFLNKITIFSPQYFIFARRCK